jgi:hypothetical protein
MNTQKINYTYMKPVASTITGLAQQYNITPRTLKNWLKDCPELKLHKNRRILSPKQVAKIYDHFGEP